MAKSPNLKNWKDFWVSNPNYPENLKILKDSGLVYKIDTENRKKLWPTLVDPGFRFENESLYDELKLKNHLKISLKVINLIRSDARNTFSLHLNDLNSDEKVVKIVNILAVFVNKRPEIGYESGMTLIVGLLVNLFEDEREAFVLFSFIIEKLFPLSYFSKENRSSDKFSELRTCGQMARVLRPKLVNCLKAEFTLTGQKKKENDFSPFYLFVQRTVEGWFSSLFVQNLLIEDCYRVWDCFFVFKFEFLVKFSLCLLSHHESFIRETVKKETKILALGTTLEALITAGNLARMKLFRKITKLPIEKILKKSMNKSSYVAIKSENFQVESKEYEKNNIFRIERLRQCKKTLSPANLNYEKVLLLLPSLSTLSVNSKISRSLFTSLISKEENWTNSMILHFFNTFDQKGEDILDFQSLFLAFSLMSSSSAEEKLRLGFKLFKTNELYQDSACELLTGLEEMLDFRSFVVRNNLKLIFSDNEQKFDFDSFSAVFFSNPLCEVLLKMINLVESDEEVNGLDLSVSSLVERFYSNIHSPLKVSGFSSLASSFEGDFQEIDEKLPVVKKYEEVITEERFKVVFEFFEVDRPGIAIFNEFQGKVIKFVVAFGRDLVEVNEDFKSNEKEVRENLEGFTKTIDIPEKLIVQKERVGCSRLCSVQSCECF